jgi:hypothetical protein
VSTNRSIAGVPVLGDLADFDRVVANLRVQGMPPAAIVITRPHQRLYPLVASAAGVLVALHAVTDFSLLMPAVALTFAAILGIGCAQVRTS